MICPNCDAEVEGKHFIDKSIRCEFCGKRLFDGTPNPLVIQ